MTKMFPDSGVPYTDAINSLSNPSTVNCNELWYSTSRCQPRFDPAAANAMLAELINLINKGEVSYDCTRNDQIEHAVRYLIQRGLPHASSATNIGGNSYTLTLDPTATRYNDYMVATVVPNVTNTGPVQLNLDGLGWRPLYRNDGTNLESQDFVSGRPYLIVYYNGAWRVPYHVASQVPVLLLQDIDTWIRTDGSDETGDGTANTPDKAFRTIAGCWRNQLRKYMACPFARINMRLGIPGTYEPAQVGPYGGRVALYGDQNNTSLYRISMFPGVFNFCLNVYGMDLYIEGVTFLVDQGDNATDPVCCRSGNGGQVTSNNIRFEVVAPRSDGLGSLVTISYAASWGFWGKFEIVGNNYSLGNAVNLYQLGSFASFGIGTPQLICNNLHLNGSFFDAQRLSTISHYQLSTVTYTAVTGLKYTLSTNSVFTANGKDTPGDTAGTVASGGQYVA